MAGPFVASTGAELRQGEILSGITRYDFDGETNGVQPVMIEFCITLNQDCDLLQDYNKRADGGAALEHFLLAEAQLASSVKTKTANDIWRRISQNQDARYQTFSPIAPEADMSGRGIGSLLVDFRSIFSIPGRDLYRQLGEGAIRRAYLDDLYRENFQLRLASYLSRVMLPEPHKYQNQ